MTENPQVSGAQVRVKRDFYPVSTSCGYRVSCAEMLGVDGFLARRVVRAGREIGLRADMHSVSSGS